MPQRPSHPIAALLATLALTLLAAACTPESTTTLAETDYRARYPIGVESEVVQAEFYGDGADQMTPDERHLLDDFVGTYIARGQKPLTIVLGGSGTERSALAEAIRTGAISHGLAKSEVVVGVDPTLPAEAVSVSFISYTAVVPECGYWPVDDGTAFANANSVNFGCASQHNLGLMVADPSDLLAPKPFDPRDGPRTAFVVELYRQGQVTGADYNSSDTSIVNIGN